MKELKKERKKKRKKNIKANTLTTFSRDITGKLYCRTTGGVLTGISKVFDRNNGEHLFTHKGCTENSLSWLYVLEEQFRRTKMQSKYPKRIRNVRDHLNVT